MSRKEDLEQAKKTWGRRLGAYQKQLAITTNAPQQFQLEEEIQKCKEKINELNEEINRLNERQAIQPPPPPEEPLDDISIPPRRRKWWVIGTAIALLTVAGTAWIIYHYVQLKDASNSQGISLGEEILIEQDIPNKEEFEKAFADRDYEKSYYLLDNYLEQKPNSPELRVYWNNVKAALGSHGNPIKIAVSIPIGTNPDVANEILRGVALAQNEFNDDRNNKNGINGQLLQVVIANDRNKDELAKKVAQRFVRDPSILAVVGHNASNASLAAKDIYKDKLVMITPTSFSDEIQNDPYIFRMVPQIGYFANKLATYIKQENPNSIVGTCIDPGTVDNDYAFITQIKIVFDKKTIELSCDFLDEKLTDDALDKKVTEILKEIKQQKIDSLVLSPYIERIAKITDTLQIIRNKNPEIRLYGSPTFFTKQTLEADKDVVEGLTLSVPWYSDDNKPKNVQFQQEFQQLYQAPTNNWRTAMAYDATWTIVKGLEQISRAKQPIEREQLNNVLHSKSFSSDGATGKTTFSEGGVNENQSDTLIQIKNGQFTPLN